VQLLEGWWQRSLVSFVSAVSSSQSFSTSKGAGRAWWEEAGRRVYVTSSSCRRRQYKLVKPNFGPLVFTIPPQSSIKSSNNSLRCTIDQLIDKEDSSGFPFYNLLVSHLASIDTDRASKAIIWTYAGQSVTLNRLAHHVSGAADAFTHPTSGRCNITAIIINQALDEINKCWQEVSEAGRDRGVEWEEEAKIVSHCS